MIAHPRWAHRAMVTPSAHALAVVLLAAHALNFARLVGVVLASALPLAGVVAPLLAKVWPAP